MEGDSNCTELPGELVTNIHTQKLQNQNEIYT